MMAGQLATHHPTDRVDEVLTIQVFEPILIGIVCVRLTVELMGRGIFDPILIMSILGKRQGHVDPLATPATIRSRPHQQADQ